MMWTTEVQLPRSTSPPSSPQASDSFSKLCSLMLEVLWFLLFPPVPPQVPQIKLPFQNRHHCWSDLARRGQWQPPGKMQRTVLDAAPTTAVCGPKACTSHLTLPLYLGSWFCMEELPRWKNSQEHGTAMSFWKISGAGMSPNISPHLTETTNLSSAGSRSPTAASTKIARFNTA